MLCPLVLLEGRPVAVQLVEDAGIGVAFDRMAGVDQGSRLRFLDDGHHIASECIERLPRPGLKVESNHQSEHSPPSLRALASSLPERARRPKSFCTTPHTECGLSIPDVTGPPAIRLNRQPVADPRQPFHLVTAPSCSAEHCGRTTGDPILTIDARGVHDPSQDLT